MKYFKRLDLFKAANVTFDPKALRAHSYGWWLFVSQIGDQVVFNDFRYSVTTAKHQSKVRALLAELGVNIDVTIESPDGLQNLESSIRYYTNQIASLNAAIAKPGTRAAKNAERNAEIHNYNLKIKAVQKLIKAQNKGLKAA